MIDKIKQIFILDLRALAIFRIGIALVLLGDIFVRLTDVRAFYSDEGFLPLSMLHQGQLNDFAFSIHTANGSLWWQCLLLFVAIVAAISMLLGYKTKLVTIISWVLLMSIQNRNHLVLQGGDDFLRLLLFWSMMLPIGRVWSLDSIRMDRPKGSSKYFSISNIGYVLLLFSVYFVSALMKFSAEWYSEGSALYYAFSLEQLTYPLAKILYPNALLLKCLTFIVIAIELLAPFLLFFPYKVKTARVVFVILISLLQVGIGLTLQVGYFYIIALVAMFGILPDSLLNRIEKTFSFITFSPKSLSLVQKAGSKRRGLGPYVATCAILISVIWNFGNVFQLPSGLKNYIKPIGLFTGLSQNWGMFAPTVYKADGWFIYKSTDGEGNAIDLLKGGEELTYKKPDWPVFQYKNAKWRKLGENLIMDKNTWVRQQFCRYVLTTYNLNHSDNVKNLEVLYMREITLPDYKVAPIDTGRICRCKLPEQERGAIVNR